MEINYCPECGTDVVYIGLARWPDTDELVNVAQCLAEDCGWAGADIESDYPVLAVKQSAA
ncbi:hypothetical protein LWF01_06650 [Saxibacter everestensis]|uniref:Uncharacterized protein n=1 Tax=Saxibacter everestensis TaxID=2909229 RepID=A0ABY8QX97_9MICO|nr:hypothetical protein LWF01_06650 [Brevibacteriaceae bacterium ZFBP1038]